VNLRLVLPKKKKNKDNLSLRSRTTRNALTRWSTSLLFVDAALTSRPWYIPYTYSIRYIHRYAKSRLIFRLTYKTRDQYARIFSLYVSPLSRHRAGSCIRESIRRKFEEWNANFQSTTATFLIVGRISIFQHLTQYNLGDARGFLHPSMEHGARNYGIAPIEEFESRR